MIPPEILKKIRQIELRPTRLVTGFAPVARLCEPQHFRCSENVKNSERLLSCAAAAGRRPALRSGARASARFTARTPAASKTNPALNSMRELKRRERRAPAAPERGCVQSTSRSTPAISNAPTNHPALRLGLRPQPRSVGGKNQLVTWPALTCVLSPRRGFQPATLSLCLAIRPINPVAVFSKDAGSVSPSPWGEGRDEGGRETNFSLAGQSFESLLQFRRVARGVENRKHCKDVILDREVDGVFFESSEANLLCASANSLKMTRVGHRPLERQLHFQFELAPQPRTFSFIPSNGFFKLQTGSGFENNQQPHFQPKRLLRPASTCSQGIPSWGFFSKSARRRSSSAACSGVRSGSYPCPETFSQRSCANLMRSFSGRDVAARRISVALMALIYRVSSGVQAVFSCRVNSSFILHPSSFPPA